MADLVQKARGVWQGSALCTAPTLQNLVPAVHSVPNGVMSASRSELQHRSLHREISALEISTSNTHLKTVLFSSRTRNPCLPQSVWPRDFLAKPSRSRKVETQKVLPTQASTFVPAGTYEPSDRSPSSPEIKYLVLCSFLPPYSVDSIGFARVVFNGAICEAISAQVTPHSSFRGN
jgi:hypothetical protein